MPLLQWDASWSTGIEAIDRQHLELLERINRLSDALIGGGLTAEIERTLCHLGDYVEIHFNAEESIMEEAGYPELERHRIIHNDLRATVTSLAESYLGEHQALPENLMAFLSSWLVEHLAGEDRLMAKFVRGRAKG